MKPDSNTSVIDQPKTEIDPQVRAEEQRARSAAAAAAWNDRLRKAFGPNKDPISGEDLTGYKFRRQILSMLFKNEMPDINTEGVEQTVNGVFMYGVATFEENIDETLDALVAELKKDAHALAACATDAVTFKKSGEQAVAGARAFLNFKASAKIQANTYFNAHV